MKIYVLDLGWRGCVIVTASSKEDAAQKMIVTRGEYITEEMGDELSKIEEFELENFTYNHYGDE